MKIKIFLFSSVFSTLSAVAQLTDNQRNGAQIPSIREPTVAEMQKNAQDIKNRWLKNNPEAIIRVVNGKTYNIQTNTDWQWIGGKVSSKGSDGILVVYQRNIYGEIIKKFALRNYSGDATADIQIFTIAIRVGTYDDAAIPIELWDCGTPYVAPPPTPEQIKAAQEAAKIAALRAKQKALEGQTNTFRWLQTLSTNGDASAQFRLANHYLNGQGCETNREQAIYWFTQSANQGNVEASNKLSALKSP